MKSEIINNISFIKSVEILEELLKEKPKSIHDVIPSEFFTKYDNKFAKYKIYFTKIKNFWIN